jgi:hypothetical protein
MKLKLAIASLLAFAVSAHATLIDLTPGGFPSADPPQVLTDWYQNTRGTLVLFDTEPGGFFDISGVGTSTFTLSWDLSGIGKFQYLLVLYTSGGVEMENFFRVPPGLERTGEASVTVNGIFTAFPSLDPALAFGKYNAPEAGTGALLLAFGLCSLLGFRIWLR